LGRRRYLEYFCLFELSRTKYYKIRAALLSGGEFNLFLRKKIIFAACLPVCLHDCGTFVRYGGQQLYYI